MNSQTSVTLHRGVPVNYVGQNLLSPVKRYRGPASCATAAGLPAFNVMNDGSVAVGDLPASFGFGEFSVAGNATIVGPVLTGSGSAAAPGVSFSADPDTGFYRPDADTPCLVAGGVERVRFIAAGATASVNLHAAGHRHGGQRGVSLLVHGRGVPSLRDDHSSSRKWNHHPRRRPGDRPRLQPV